MADQQKRCIFCRSQEKLTDEHIFGDWIKAYVPRTHNKHEFANVLVRSPGIRDPADRRIRAGDPLASRVRVVCGRCNSGWMSRLQERAKPYLLPLFRGDFMELDTAAQTIIATWATMATMTSEFLARDVERIVVPQRERTWLMQRNTVPGGWRVWVGRYKRNIWPGQWVRTTLPIRTEQEIKHSSSYELRVPNVQTTAFVVGELYLFAMSGPFPVGWDWRSAPRARSALIQIWPIIRNSAPSALVDMTDTDAEAFATAVLRYSDDLAKRVGHH